jgi:hypothetical protein
LTIHLKISTGFGRAYRQISEPREVSGNLEDIQKGFSIGKCEHVQRKVRVQSSAIQDSSSVCSWRPTGIARSVHQRNFDFCSINGCQDFLHASKKLRILISMKTGEFILSA